MSPNDPASHIPLAQSAQLRCRSRHDCWTPGASLQPWLLKIARFHSIQRNLPLFIGIIRGSACCYMHCQKLNLKSLTRLCKGIFVGQPQLLWETTPADFGTHPSHSVPPLQLPQHCAPRFGCLDDKELLQNLSNLVKLFLRFCAW